MKKTSSKKVVKKSNKLNTKTKRNVAIRGLV